MPKETSLNRHRGPDDSSLVALSDSETQQASRVRNITLQIGGAKQNAAKADEAFRAVLHADLTALQRCIASTDLLSATADRITFNLHIADRSLLRFVSTCQQQSADSTASDCYKVTLSRCSLLDCALFTGDTRLISFLLSVIDLHSQSGKLELKIKRSKQQLPDETCDAAFELTDASSLHIAIVLSREDIACEILKTCQFSRGNSPDRTEEAAKFSVALLRGVFSIHDGNALHLCTLLSVQDVRFIRMLRLLIDASRSIDHHCRLVHVHHPVVRTVEEATPLHLAVLTREERTFRVLLNAPVAQDKTACALLADSRKLHDYRLINKLHYCHETSDEDEWKIHDDVQNDLLESVDRNGDTALDYAVLLNDEHFALKLLQIGARKAHVQKLVDMGNLFVDRFLIGDQHWFDLLSTPSVFSSIVRDCSAKNVGLMLEISSASISQLIDCVEQRSTSANDHPILQLQHHKPQLLGCSSVTSWTHRVRKQTLVLQAGMLFFSFLCFVDVNYLDQYLCLPAPTSFRMLVTLAVTLVRVTYEIVSEYCCTNRPAVRMSVMLTAMVYASLLATNAGVTSSGEIAMGASILHASELAHLVSLLSAVITVENNRMYLRWMTLALFIATLMIFYTRFSLIICWSIILPTAVRQFASDGFSASYENRAVFRIHTHVTASFFVHYVKICYRKGVKLVIR